MKNSKAIKEKPIMKAVCIVALIALSAALSFGQKVYSVPFASSGNTIDLTITNISQHQGGRITIKPLNVPGWLHIVPQEISFQPARTVTTQSASFAFSVEKTAPAAQPYDLKFRVIGGKNESWDKTIRLSVEGPEDFRLFQNYPNPFNPSTKIAYQVPSAGQVTLKIYNLLGQTVATLFQGAQPAGYFEQEWNAGASSSGIYFARMTYVDKNGSFFVSTKLMTLMK